MILAYNLIEELILKAFKESTIDITPELEKTVDRFDKCKALALDTKVINERKLAFDRSVELFKKILKLEV